MEKNCYGPLPNESQYPNMFWGQLFGTLVLYTYPERSLKYIVMFTKMPLFIDSAYLFLSLPCLLQSLYPKGLERQRKGMCGCVFV